MGDAWDWVAKNWQFVLGTALGVLGILVGIGIAFWQRQPKRLGYIIETDLPLLSKSARVSTLRKRLTVDYDGVTLKDPHLVTIRIINTGKRAVVAADYVDPIAISYENNPPFDGFVSDESRKNLWPRDLPLFEDPLDPVPKLRPPLLNKWEWFDVQLHSDGDPGRISVSCLFADQAGPMKRIGDQGERATRRARLIGIAGVLSGTLTGVLLGLLSR